MVFLRRSRCPFMFLIAATMLCCLLTAVAYAAEFNFSWEGNSEPNLAGYKLYYKSGACCEPYDGTGADQGDSPISIALGDLSDLKNPQYTVTGLDDDTIYFFSITAVDTDDFQSDYAGELNNIPPSITSQPIVVSKTDVSAVIAWQTDQPATSQVDYGTSTSYGSKVEETDYVTRHSVSISGLSPGTLYHFNVSATDEDGFGPDTLTTDNNPSSDAPSSSKSWRAAASRMPCLTSSLWRIRRLTRFASSIFSNV